MSIFPHCNTCCVRDSNLELQFFFTPHPKQCRSSNYTSFMISFRAKVISTQFIALLKPTGVIRPLLFGEVYIFPWFYNSNLHIVRDSHF